MTFNFQITKIPQPTEKFTARKKWRPTLIEPKDSIGLGSELQNENFNWFTLISIRVILK